MKQNARVFVLSAVTAIAVMAGGSPAATQDYPSRPIRVLTTTSAGGISDVFMRALGEELRVRLGQPIVVENRPGGMQNVGARACTEAAPDGYTICILNADPLVYNQFLLKNMPFDPENGVQPITNLFHLTRLRPEPRTQPDQACGKPRSCCAAMRFSLRHTATCLDIPRQVV